MFNLRKAVCTLYNVGIEATLKCVFMYEKKSILDNKRSKSSKFYFKSECTQSLKMSWRIWFELLYLLYLSYDSVRFLSVFSELPINLANFTWDKLRSYLTIQAILRQGDKSSALKLPSRITIYTKEKVNTMQVCLGLLTSFVL